MIRFSALGDVAMTVPVVYSLAERYPQADITVLSRPFARPLFADMPDNVHFRGADLGCYHGTAGMFRLFRELKREGYDMVADLHDVLRTKLLRAFFWLAGAKVAHIDKGRSGRKGLTRMHGKKLRLLPSSFSRYGAVFGRLGLPVETVFSSVYGKGRGDSSLFAAVTGNPDDGKHWIGIAPFAAHKGKMIPLATVEELVRRLSERHDLHIFLFGGGRDEWETLKRLAGGLQDICIPAGRLNMEQELALMSYLDVMVSMDSANMHLASLVGTPVISVWGATHPFAGFMGWGQSADNAVQADLPCRPCSIFGNKPCLRGDYACLKAITAEEIIRKIDNIIFQQGKKANA